MLSASEEPQGPCPCQGTLCSKGFGWIFAGISDVPVPGGGLLAFKSVRKKKDRNKVNITVESLTILLPFHYNFL